MEQIETAGPIFDCRSHLNQTECGLEGLKPKRTARDASVAQYTYIKWAWLELLSFRSPVVSFLCVCFLSSVKGTYTDILAFIHTVWEVQGFFLPKLYPNS